MPGDDLGFLQAFAEIGQIEALHRCGSPAAAQAKASARRAAATIRASLGM
jgi:hypothetical protein